MTAGVSAAVSGKGAITIATVRDFPPNEFVAPDGRSIIGMDVDLGRALGKLMHRKVRIVGVGFRAIIRGVATGKYNLGIASITDTKAREKTVDFVTYFLAGTSFMVKAQGGPTINALADLCGYTVASPGPGTTEYADATRQSDQCRAAGKAPVTVLTSFPSFQSALLSGTAQVAILDSPVAAYDVKQSPELRLVGQTYGMAPYGIAVRKGRRTLAHAVLAGLDRLMANGSYNRILAKWGNGAGAIINPQIDGAVS